MGDGFHKPVLLNQVICSLSAREAELIIDATVGHGGYAQALLEKMSPRGRVIGIDQDPQALQVAKERLAVFGDRFVTFHGNFRHIKQLLAPLNLPLADGIIVDLGVSAGQISDPQRGFMFSADGPLSMQMNPGQGISAAEIVNEYSLQQLIHIIRQYGEERAAARIAKAIVDRRRIKPILTTGELAEVVRRAAPGRYVIKTLARVFQSIRMVVNDEPQSLQEFLPQAVDLLRRGGRLVVLSYHSGEDRIVKRFLQQQANPCVCSPALPRCVCGAIPRLKIIGRVVMADAEEVKNNPQSRSVRLRCAEKL